MDPECHPGYLLSIKYWKMQPIFPEYGSLSVVVRGRLFLYLTLRELNGIKLVEEIKQFFEGVINDPRSIIDQRVSEAVYRL